MKIFKKSLLVTFSASNDLDGIKSLLELSMKVTPKTASNILKVAKHLANAIQGMSSKENSTVKNYQCQGVEHLVYLGEILAKAVPGCEDVDTVNCELNELPTIPTDKEIFKGK